MVRKRGPEPDGPMAGHVRDGRRYLSPMAAIDVLEMTDWVRDDLPDLIWPLLVLAETGNEGARRFVRWQADVQRALSGRCEATVLADGLDGRLTSLDRLVAAVPESRQTIVALAEARGLLSKPVRRVLASYPYVPAAWLHGMEMSPPGQAEVDLCARAILDVLTDGHREALVKCLWTWSAVQAKTFSAGPELIELLKPYPDDPKTRAQADSAIRACWSAMNGTRLQAEPSWFDPTTNWAKVFWGANSMTTRCIRRRDLKNDDAERDVATLDDNLDVHAEAGDGNDGAHLQQLAMDLVASYVEALETAPARLYDNERQEVHSGLVARAGREVIAALGARDLWCSEHGSHVVRVLVEVRIYLGWMAQQEVSIYADYQAYGAGKAKLYERILNEVVQDLGRPDIDEAMKELKRLSHNDDVLDFRVVDTRDSFAGGKSIRTMAQECGMLNLYRQIYYMASGVAHSEWWSVETHCMERCMNILHRCHLVPSLSRDQGGSVELARAWIDQLYALIRESLSILGTSESCVRAAFAWLDEEPRDSPAAS